MSAHEPNPIQRRPLAAFFVLAYAISWGLSLFAAQGMLPFAAPPIVALVVVLVFGAENFSRRPEGRVRT